MEGIYGLNRSSGLNRLFAVYGNDVVDVDVGTGFSLNLTSGNKAEFATYLDYAFLVNGYDGTKAYDGSSWYTSGYRVHCPIARYIKPYKTKLYLGYLTIGNKTFGSRVWGSDLPYNNDIRWGIEWGGDLSQSSSSATITSAGSAFITQGIKVGDPVFILDGANKGEYTVLTIDSETQITLTSTLTNAVSGTNFIIGSNFFDVETNNNDVIRGLGENSSRLLIFKLFSLHTYNGATLLPVVGALGTSSHRSIINVRGYTLYFHGSETNKTGYYLFDGSQTVKVSQAIQPFIDGIDSDNYPDIVSWNEGNLMRSWVGDIDNSQYGISLDNVIVSFDVVNNKWSVDPTPKTIRCATTYLEDNMQKIFLGDSVGEVFQTPSGYSHDGTAISFIMETGPHYPAGSEQNININRIQVISRDAKGVRVSYKLYNNPSAVDDTWHPLGQITDDKTEFDLVPGHKIGAGINLRCDEESTTKPTLKIEKFSIFYTLDSTRIK